MKISTTILWVVGLTNAFNLIDILDGLCSTQAVISSIGLFFVFILSDSEFFNCIAITMAGANLGFIPYNFSNKHKCFLGDSGSNFIGFVIAALCINMNYNCISTIGSLIIPFFIVSVPIIDTFTVIMFRVLRGRNPLKGSRDHIALRLKDSGWPLFKILRFFVFGGILCNVLAIILYLIRYTYWGC